MEHKRLWVWAIPLSLFFLFLHSCLPEDLGPGSGFLTREVEVSEEYSGWEQINYQTGRSLVEADNETGLNYIYLELNIPLPGRYYPWILAAFSGDSVSESRQLRVRITPVRAHSQSIIDSLLITIPAGPLLSWRQPEGEKKGLEFVEYGPHIIVLEGLEPREGRLILDKFLLTGNPEAQPSGYALSPREKSAAILPPAWAFGATYGGALDQNASRALVAGLKKVDLPISALWTDFGGQGLSPGVDLSGDWASAIRDWKSQGIHFGAWLSPELSESGAASAFQLFESREFFREKPRGTVGDRVAAVDFEVPEAVDQWEALLQPLFGQELDFLRLGPPINPLFLQAAYGLSAGPDRRGWVLAPPTLLSEAGMLRYPGVALGANEPDWPEGGLKTNLTLLSDPRMPLNGAPFFGIENPAPARVAPEKAAFLWFQPLSVFRVEEPGAFLSWAANDSFRYYAHLRQQLFPFLYSYAHHRIQTGENLIQSEHRFSDQYFFGRELLIAPLAGAGGQSRQIYFPAGRWVSYYDHQILEGGSKQSFTAPAGRMPLFVRGGSIVPLRPYAPSIEAGGSDTLMLRIYPAGVESGQFTLWEDDGESLDYQEGQVAQTTISYRLRGERLELNIAAVEGNYRGMPEERVWIIQLLSGQKPTQLRWNGDTLGPQDWSYDEKLQWLEVLPKRKVKNEKQQLTVSF